MDINVTVKLTCDEYMTKLMFSKNSMAANIKEGQTPLASVPEPESAPVQMPAPAVPCHHFHNHLFLHLHKLLFLYRPKFPWQCRCQPRRKLKLPPWHQHLRFPWHRQSSTRRMN